MKKAMFISLMAIVMMALMSENAKGEWAWINPKGLYIFCWSRGIVGHNFHMAAIRALYSPVKAL